MGSKMKQKWGQKWGHFGVASGGLWHHFGVRGTEFGIRGNPKKVGGTPGPGTQDAFVEEPLQASLIEQQTLLFDVLLKGRSTHV